MSEHIGLDMVLARNTGTYGVPTWTTVPIVREVTLDMTASEADVSSRNQKFKLKRSALMEVSLEAEVIYNPSDTNYTSIRDNFINQTLGVEFAAADGAIATTGTQYLRLTCQVFKFSRNEPLEGPVTVTFAIKPTPNANANPAWTTT